MAVEVLQRERWSGDPTPAGRQVPTTQDRKSAECQLWSHQLRWELWLIAAGEFLQSQVCRSQDEVFDTSDQWKAAMVAKGWS